MDEETFEHPIPGGALRGHRGGSGAPALLLHGGAAIPDYTAECARALDGLFATIRYTQRGTPPSEADRPYTVEAHMDDAIALLDAFGHERAWAIGHSWGGHLALHLLTAHPGRLLGVLCIDPLGADGGIFAEYEANLRRGMTADEIAVILETEERRRTGEVSEAALIERFAVVWPQFFAQRIPLVPPPERVGVEASIDTNRSLADHLSRRTLALALPAATLPALFVHGELDPLPLRTTIETAALIPGARVEIVTGSGHFPWLEQPDAFRAAVERLLR